MLMRSIALAIVHIGLSVQNSAYKGEHTDSETLGHDSVSHSAGDAVRGDAVLLRRVAISSLLKLSKSHVLYRVPMGGGI